MPTFIIGSQVGLALLAIWLGVGAQPYASTLIRIREGAVHVRRGRVQPYAKEHVVEILREAGVSKGFIAVTSENGVAFSRSIPSTVRQRLRNVLLNQ